MVQKKDNFDYLSLIIYIISILLFGIGIVILVQNSYQSGRFFIQFAFFSLLLFIFALIYSIFSKYKFPKFLIVIFVVIICSLIISSVIYISWWKNNDTEYSIFVSISPDNEDEYEVLLPVPLDSYGSIPPFIIQNGLEINETIHGKAIKITSKSDYFCKKEGRTDEGFHKISMINGSDPFHWRWMENRSFWVYSNTSNNNLINIDIEYSYYAVGGDMTFLLSGTLFNGWQLVNGTSDGSVV